ncbi:MAG: bacteriocin [Verrucomicrobia bacterium]|nr:bacteriocin [Verrucomicrobiota bacterium]
MELTINEMAAVSGGLTRNPADMMDIWIISPHANGRQSIDDLKRGILI